MVRGKHISIGVLKKIRSFFPNSKHSDKLNALEKQGIIKFLWLIAKKTFGALNSAEKKVVFFLLAVILFSSFGLAYNFWVKNTVAAPSEKSALVEGVIGAPRYINPILAQTNEVDLDLAKLIFSSLYAPDANGDLANDLAEEYAISDDKKTYTIKIKDGIRWHDGEKLTADDVIFTVKSIQNPNYKSPLRANLMGADAEKIDDYTIKFSLKAPYEPFLQNLTFGILPQHIWQYINAENTPLAEYNIKPIGSGAYKLDKITKDKLGKVISIGLAANGAYYGRPSYIKKITFKFFKNQGSLADALNKNEINATAYLDAGKISEVKSKNFKNYDFKTPRYFAVFFNEEQSKILAEKPVRAALNYLTDKNQIIEEAIGGNGQKTDTPIPPALEEYYSSGAKIYNFDPNSADAILKNSGWIIKNDWRVKEINNKDKKTKQEISLEIALTTGDSPELKKIGEILKNQWQKGGVKVNLNFLNPAEIQSAIKNRDYEALLFGEILNLNPDPFIFWHSSELRDPGLNLALYSNKDADKFLEDYRQTFNADSKKEILAKFQAEVAEDAPAVFLFNPYLAYWTDKDLKGIGTKIINMPADRFSDISGWYTETKRVWKK